MKYKPVFYSEYFEYQIFLENNIINILYQKN